MGAEPFVDAIDLHYRVFGHRHRRLDALRDRFVRASPGEVDTIGLPLPRLSCTV
jgi:hypothetical protein